MLQALVHVDVLSYLSTRLMPEKNPFEIMHERTDWQKHHFRKEFTPPITGKNRPPKSATFNQKSMKSFGIRQRGFVFISGRALF